MYLRAQLKFYTVVFDWARASIRMTGVRVPQYERRDEVKLPSEWRDIWRGVYWRVGFLELSSIAIHSLSSFNLSSLVSL